jgi:DHA1 family inner membrane transport protein
MGLIPSFTRKVFHGGTGMTGAFSTLQGMGALLGAVFITSLVRRYGRWRMLQSAGLLLVVAYLLYANAPTFHVALLAVPFLGAGSALWFANVQGLAQRDAPAEERGRVLSLNQAAMGMSYGLGVAVVGRIGDVFGMRVAFSLAALLAGASLVAIGRRFPHWRDVADPVVASEPIAVAA